MTLPNLLSASRFAFAPVLLYLAWNDEARAFLLLLGAVLLTDVADGYLARKLGQASELGVWLDTWGDVVTYLAAGVCIWWLWPELVRREVAAVLVVVVSYALTMTIGFLRYRRLTSFHTWGGKVSAVTLGIGAMILLVGGPPWPLRVAAVVVVVSDIEELAMMSVLPEWRPDVPSLWHALRRRLEQ
jgi:CDP-diacylglycerol--glycerol-3-phosphate 3-phosphatidyltransferase